MSRPPYVIGLTGNIATGKSAVAGMLSGLGAEHLDADLLAHQVMAIGTPVWESVAAVFGPAVLEPGGEIDRSKLGAIVFSDPDALARLESIVHPEVIDRVVRFILASTSPVVVVEAIKLIESGMVGRLCDATWVVTARREAQIQRLIEQRHLSHADAVLRIDAQPPQEAKVACADVVIDNNGALDDTMRQVEEAWAKISTARDGNVLTLTDERECA